MNEWVDSQASTESLKRLENFVTFDTHVSAKVSDAILHPLADLPHISNVIAPSIHPPVLQLLGMSPVSGRRLLKGAALDDLRVESSRTSWQPVLVLSGGFGAGGGLASDILRCEEDGLMLEDTQIKRISGVI